MDNNIVVFSKQWFGKHQNKLLFLLNNKFTRFVFRKIMRIDCDKDIIALLPNSYIIKGSKDNEYVADFRTHDKYAKRLYYAFKPFWYLIHAFDTLFANKWIPEWNLGFDTLTVYPEPGSTADDGISFSDGFHHTLSNITSQTSGNVQGFTSTGFYCGVSGGGAANVDSLDILFRSIFLFNTSSLTSSSVISSSVFSLYGSLLEQSGAFTNSIHCVSSTPNSNTTIISSDFGQLGNTSFGSISETSYSSSGYNNITLNASGISNISKTGVSKFGTKCDVDLNYTNYTSINFRNQTSIFYGYYSDNTGTNNDPKLVITYTLASSFIPQILFL